MSRRRAAIRALAVGGCRAAPAQVVRDDGGAGERVEEEVVTSGGTPRARRVDEEAAAVATSGVPRLSRSLERRSTVSPSSSGTSQKQTECASTELRSYSL